MAYIGTILKESSRSPSNIPFQYLRLRRGNLKYDVSMGVQYYGDTPKVPLISQLSPGSTGLRLGGLLHRVSAAAQPFTAAAVTAVATSPPPPSTSPPPPPPPPSPSPPPPSPPARGGDNVVPRDRGRVRAYIEYKNWHRFEPGTPVKSIRYWFFFSWVPTHLQGLPGHTAR